MPPKARYIVVNKEGMILHFDDLYDDRPFPKNTMWLHHFHYPDILWIEDVTKAKKMFDNFPEFKDCCLEDYYGAYNREYGDEAV